MRWLVRIFAFAALLLSAMPLAAQEGVRVTGSVYADYARVVFNAPLGGDFEVAINGDRLVVTLSEPVQPNFREALGPLKEYIANATVQGGGKQVLFKLRKTNVKLRKFRSAGFFGVDIVPLGKETPAVAAKKKDEASASTKKESAAPRSITPPAVQKKEAPKAETETAAVPLAKTPRPSPRPSSIPQEGEPDNRAGLEGTPAPAKKGGELAESGTAGKEQRVATPVAVASGGGTGEEIARIGFSERVPAAIYVRGRNVWAVFGKAASLPVGTMAKGKVVAARQLPDRHNTILKLTLRPDVDMAGIWAGRDQFDWVIRSGKPPVVTPLPVGTKLGANPAVKIDVLQAGEPLNFTDPDIGDELFIVPVRDPGNLVNPERRYVDMQVLPSLQGVVIRRVSEDARFKVDRDGVSVSALRGLMASEVIMRDERPEEDMQLDKDSAPTAVELTKNSMFPFAANPEAKDFMPGYYGTLGELIRDPEAKRSEKQLTMAKFLFAQELYPEALGVLRQILADDPDYPGGDRVRDMVAASQFLMGRYDQAEDAFAQLVASDRNMAFKDEQKLWLWASNVMNARENLAPFTSGENFDPSPAIEKYMTAYPLALRRQFLLLDAEQMLTDNRTGHARKFLDEVKKLAPNAADKEFADYLHARVMEAERKDDMAIEAYNKLIENADSARTRASAAYALARFLKENGKKTSKEVIPMLEKARLDWRGDRLEVDILRTLGQYYIDDGQYVEGLRAWRTLVSNYAGTTTALEVAGDMARIYAGLFESPDADKMPSVQALGLFFEFNELMPVGVAGDRISRRLADHLESVDLLESAAAILTHQVRYRSQGAERAQLAAKLVGLHLANNRADLATEVLDAMAKEPIPENLMAHYRYLRAETLVRGGKYDAALALINADTTPEAKELKFAIYWYQQQWERIIDVLEPELKARAGNKDTLTPDEEERVLRLAIAYSRLRRWNDVTWLRQAYDNRLKQEEVDEAFDFVTERGVTVDHTKLDATLELDKLESFLKTYRRPEPVVVPPAAAPAAAPAAPGAPAEGAAPAAEGAPKAAAPAAEPVAQTPPAAAKQP